MKTYIVTNPRGMPAVNMRAAAKRGDEAKGKGDLDHLPLPNKPVGFVAEVDSVIPVGNKVYGFKGSIRYTLVDGATTYAVLQDGAMSVKPLAGAVSREEFDALKEQVDLLEGKLKTLLEG